MNISLIRLKPIARELVEIRKVLERIADCMEFDMAEKGLNVRPPKADTSGKEPTISYTDEEIGYIEERVEFLRREQQREMEDEEVER
jgi:hypothetical protein